MTYAPPLADMGFALRNLIGVPNMQQLGFEVTPELIDDVLSGAGALAAGTFAPLNYSGNKTGARMEDGKAVMPEGFAAAYRAFTEGGWNAVPFDAEIGGMGLPWSVAFCIQEMFQAANLSLALATLLNQGAIELLATHGQQEVKNRYLPKLVSGAWTGTMNITEPQAGSDVAAIRTTAKPQDGYFSIVGQKIFISYGDHDMAENILHFVLARLPDAPPGTKGLSLFLVPKMLVKSDGTLGKANDVRVVSIEHKLGQHASPTCVMAYGDNGGAIGYLIGQQHGGMAAMFTMMNNARIGVGIQGLALAERAYQDARNYAQTRVQGHDMRLKKNSPPVPIIAHPDVKRMLMTMRSQIEAGRAFFVLAGHMADRTRKNEDDRLAAIQLDLFTPILKAWLTDMSNEVTSLAIQVCGGMGYIEEAGIAQHYRDARVLAIYEGTNGIQAQDLVFRKLASDQGMAMFRICTEIKKLESELGRLGTDRTRKIREQLAFARTDLESATQAMVDYLVNDRLAAAAGAAHYLRLAGIVLGGLCLAQSAAHATQLLAAAPAEDQAFLNDKNTTALFYAEQILPQTTGLRMIITDGKDTVCTVSESYF
ncbi:MAG: acyl-CoA dehydrogenase [Alphaproteobacteria bacterium]